MSDLKRDLTAVAQCNDIPRMNQRDRAEWLAQHVLPCEPDVRSWLVHRLRGLSRTDIDDAIQESYARLWEVDYTRIVNARAYFFTIARNVISDMLRRSRVVPIQVIADIEWLHISGEEADLERRLSEREELEQLRLAVSKLPPQCRRVFALRTFEGLSQREIALQTGLTESTVEKHLSKGLRLVMKHVQEPQAAPPDRKASFDEVQSHKKP